MSSLILPFTQLHCCWVFGASHIPANVLSAALESGTVIFPDDPEVPRAGHAICFREVVSLSFLGLDWRLDFLSLERTARLARE